jgi:hypothetical protein
MNNGNERQTIATVDCRTDIKERSYSEGSDGSRPTKSRTNVEGEIKSRSEMPWGSDVNGIKDPQTRYKANKTWCDIARTTTRKQDPESEKGMNGQ